MKKILITGAVAVLALAGLSSLSQDPAPAVSATPAPVAAPAPAQPSQAPAPEPEAPAFVDWIQANYPGVSWAPRIQSGAEKFGWVWVETDLYPDADATAPARAICMAGKAYALETGAPFTGDVTVRASTGLRLAEC